MFNLIISFLIIPQLSFADEKLFSYEELVNQAQNNCISSKRRSVDIDLLWKLVQVEKMYSPPPEVRGMLLSAACMESGFNPNAKGDRKFSKNGKTPRAIGILQMWKVYERAYGTNRFDPVSSAHGWMQHIVRMLPKVKKLCKYRTPKRIWIAAWVTGIRSPKKGGRCRESPKHLRILKKWQRNIKKLRPEPAHFECDC
jgi:hypothetical protein